MRVGFVCKEQKISEHFGKSNNLKIYEITEDSFELVEELNQAVHEHHGFINLLLNAKLNQVVLGGMGTHARQRLEAQGIDIISGISGDFNQVLSLYLEDKLESVVSDCKGHNHDHDHHHHHDKHKGES